MRTPRLHRRTSLQIAIPIPLAYKSRVCQIRNARTTPIFFLIMLPARIYAVLEGILD